MPVSNQPATAGSPRDNQKARTREALVAAATELLRSGGAPTVAEAAEHAKVSRATAYRYFPTQDALLVEISRVNPVAAPVEEWLANLQEPDPAVRISQLVTRFGRVVTAEEVTLRTALRTYLDTWLQARARGEEPEDVREGRRMRWLDEALAPVRAQLKPAQWKRLRNGLALTLGIEPMVVMKDVCHCSDAEAIASLEWVALALLRTVLDEAGAGGNPPTATPKKGSARR